MASNVLPGGNSSWGSKHFPLSPAALVGAPESRPPQVSNEDSESGTNSGRSVPPNAPSTTAAAAAVGNDHRGQYPLHLQPPNPLYSLAGAGAGLLHGKSGDDGRDVGGVGFKHPDALRMMLLEAEITSSRSRNMHLQHHVAFLETQMSGHLGLIAVLHNKIRALEADLKSAKETTEVVVGATPNASTPTATCCGLADACPPQPTNPGPAEELVQHRSAPPGPEKEGTAGNYAVCDLRPHDGCRAMAAASDRHGGSDVAAPGSAEVAQRTVAAPLTLSPENGGEATAVEGFPRAAEAKLAPSADAPTPGSLSSALATAAVQQAESVGDESDDSIAPAPTTPRHSLRDFWADSSSNDIDDSPPSSNTRNKRHQAQQQPPDTSLPSALQGGKSSESLQAAAVDTDVTPASQEGTSAPTGTSGPATAESRSPAEPQTVLFPILRRITEGREGAEDRSSHLLDCAICQNSLPEGDSIGRCERCPRSFCSQCLERGLVEQGVELEALGQDCRSLLNGKQGDFSIARCPECCRGKDNEFAPPPPGGAPMDYLLNELLRHDLSLCFREPVDIAKHPDYVESIGRTAMMDLGTMLSKLQGKRYPRRRGPGQFMEDLNRIWRNCRRFAGCDELGRPHYGKTVPGIVRCALTLEAMSGKFFSSYMSDNQGTAAWQESTWDFHRQRQERENAEARRKQLGHLGVDGGKEEVQKPLAPGGGDMRLVASVQQASNETESEQKCNMQENERLAGESAERTSAAAAQQSADEVVATVGCKRSASELAAVAEEGSVQSRRTRRAASISLEPTAASLGGGNPPTPRVTRRPVGKTQSQQPPWSPLDKLCDLATTFQK